MDNEYTFQPQLNTRSRHLARHAPTLRERQEQEEQLRRSASRASPAAHHPPRSRRQQQRSSAERGDDAVESVWALWRAVAAGEGREEERVYVNVAASGELPRPPAVNVSTVLTMLKALGLDGPQHAALIDKFLAALGVAGEDDEETVEAERFAHVFTTVWRAAVTNRTRWSPAPAPAVARSTAPRSASPAAVPVARSAVAAAPTTPVMSTPVSRASPPSSRSTSVASSTASSSSPASGASAGSDSDDGAFLHTNMSRTPSSEAQSPSPDAKPAQSSPPSPAETPGLSASPDPRNPQAPSPSMRTTSHATRYGRSPFSATPAPLRSSRSVSMRRRPDGQRGTPRVLPSDSHLLATTASCERKKSAKRVPGGLMRECTFAPKINDVFPPAALHAATVERRETRRAEHADATASLCFQPNTQQFHGGDGSGRVDSSRAPLAPGFDTAVRRMIAARRQQQQERVTASAPRVLKRESAVRTAEAPLVYVDVDLPHGEAGRIALFRGADVAKLAGDFAAQHHLDARLRDRLEDALRTQLQAHS